MPTKADRCPAVDGVAWPPVKEAAVATGPNKGEPCVSAALGRARDPGRQGTEAVCGNAERQRGRRRRRAEQGSASAFGNPGRRQPAGLEIRVAATANPPAATDAGGTAASRRPPADVISSTSPRASGRPATSAAEQRRRSAGHKSPWAAAASAWPWRDRRSRARSRSSGMQMVGVPTRRAEEGRGADLDDLGRPASSALHRALLRRRRSGLRRHPAYLGAAVSPPARALSRKAWP